MYITVENIFGEKTINLFYPIQNLDGFKEIAVIEIFADNVTYEITSPLKLTLASGEGLITSKQIPRQKYTSRELNAFLVGNGTLTTPLTNNPRVIKTNKLANITELNFQLSELDNTNNLLVSGDEPHLDGRLSNNLMTYHISEYADVTSFEPKNPQYKKLKNGIFQSLTLKITDQHGDLVSRASETSKDSLETSVILHVR